jgi:hypothetical protein
VLPDSLHDGGLQFPTIGPAQVELIAGETDWNWIARFPFSGSVVIGRCAVVLTRVDHSREVNDDRASKGVATRFAKNFGLGLAPVLYVTALETSTELVEFNSALANCLTKMRRIVPGSLLHLK